MSQNAARRKSNNRTDAIFCWSGGKDSALALHRVLQSGEWNVRYLLCTLNGEHHRISMHGVREELLDAQSASIGIPLVKVFTYEASNEEYERQMEAALSKVKDDGIDHVIFGDIFLEDLRTYRENNLARIGMTAVFPLWKSDTRKLIEEFLDKKFRTITCCVNDACLKEEHAGAIIDMDFINTLPANVDPCGENGEFHTFCFDGPIFSKRIDFEKGEKVYKALPVSSIANQEQLTKGFWYCELAMSSEL